MAAWRRSLWFALVTILLAVAAFALKGRLAPGDRRKISQALESTRQAFVSHDEIRLLGFISPGYRDADGRSRSDVAQGVRRVLGEYPSLRADLHVADVRVAGDSAQANLSLVVVGTNGLGETGYLVGAIGEPEKVRVSLLKEGGEWKIVGAYGFTE
jgi:hypothetical protein